MSTRSEKRISLIVHQGRNIQSKCNVHVALIDESNNSTSVITDEGIDEIKKATCLWNPIQEMMFQVFNDMASKEL
jgi:hypothetical protein